MGLLDWLLPGRGHGVAELARRLGVEPRELRRIEPRYREFTIAKRSGGRRRILAPEPELKAIQRRILRRLLARLRVHPSATGFEPGRSIVTNAMAHRGQAVVVRMDVKDFFPSTSATRLKRYLRRIGWNRPAAALLVRLCTRDGGLPQGAPTSPRLSNLLNYRLDARLSGMATRLGAVYTRYADDVTISFAENDGPKIHAIERFVRRVAGEEGYRLHHRKKLSIRRQHHRQMVTGLVVNQRVGLPRETRRWLRAVEHRARTQKPVWSSSDGPPKNRSTQRPTLSESQLEGWRSLQAMIARQTAERP